MNARVLNPFIIGLFQLIRSCCSWTLLNTKPLTFQSLVLKLHRSVELSLVTSPTIYLNDKTTWRWCKRSRWRKYNVIPFYKPYLKTLILLLVLKEQLISIMGNPNSFETLIYPNICLSSTILYRFGLMKENNVLLWYAAWFIVWMLTMLLDLTSTLLKEQPNIHYGRAYNLWNSHISQHLFILDYYT